MTDLKANVEKMRELYRLLRSAFGAYYSVAIAKVKSGKRLSQIPNPTMTIGSNGMPSFTELGILAREAKYSLASALHGNGLFGRIPLGGDFIPEFRRLEEFLRNDPLFSKRFEQKDFDFALAQILESCLDRAYSVGGETLSEDDMKRLLRPVIFALWREHLPVSIMVPFPMVSFEPKSFRLDDTSFIARLPKRVQLARYCVLDQGSGVVSAAAGAATHAFVSKDWSLENLGPTNTRTNLSERSEHVDATIDRVLGSIHLCSTAQTGYAQVLFIPKGWVYEYQPEFMPLYGYSVRRYPNHFDRNYWRVGETSHLTKAECQQVSETYKLLGQHNENKIRFALRRLNSCAVRDDDMDAVLDAVIGLELLLSKDENDAINYKLRIRAASLAKLTKNYDPAQVFESMGKVYSARSAIAHGSSKVLSKKTLSHEVRPWSGERTMAFDLLKFVLQTQLNNPKYLDPMKIDQDLVVGATGAVPEDPLRSET